MICDGMTSYPVVWLRWSALYALAVTAAAIQIISQPLNQRVQSGDRVQMSCTFQDIERSHVIIWTHNHVILSEGSTVFRPSGISIEVEADEDIATYTVTIDSATVDHEGLYECQVPGHGLSQVSKLTVNVPPSITLFYPDPDSMPYDVSSGDILQLECRANGKPPPNITWTRQQGGDVREHLVYSSQLVSSYIVEDVTPRDMGVYVCTADNGIAWPAVKTIRVNVVFPPNVTVVDRVRHVGYGGELHIACRVESNPPSSFLWRLNGSKIDVTSRRGDVTFDTSRISDTIHESVLRIRRVQLRDVGVYTCIAASNLGSAFVDIVVTGIPDEISFDSDDFSEYSNQYTLRWTVRSRSPLIDTELLLKSESSVINESVDELLMFSALVDTSSIDVMDSSRHQLFYVISGLQPDTHYTLSLRMSNVFGFSNWTELMFFETAEAGRPAPRVSAARSSHSRRNASPSIVLQSTNQPIIVVTTGVILVQSLRTILNHVKL